MQQITHLHQPPWGLVLKNSAFFPGSTSVGLKFTPAVSADRTNFYFETWVRRADMSGVQVLFYAGDGTVNNQDVIYFASGRLTYYLYIGGSAVIKFTTTATFDDPTLWYHVAVFRNGTTVRMWVDGVEVTDFVESVTSAADGYVGHTVEHYVGLQGSIQSPFNGWLARTILVTGSTAISPADTLWLYGGEYAPKPPVIPDYGNGFLLEYADGADMGKDTSGNGNDLVAATTAATQDGGESPTDSKGGANGCGVVLNPYENYAGAVDMGTLSNGNRTYTRTSDNSGRRCTFGAGGGRINLPFKLETVGGSTQIGFVSPDADPGGYAGYWGHTTGACFVLEIRPTVITLYDRNAGTGPKNGTTIGTGGASDGDVFAFELDFDADTIDLLKNGVLFAHLFTSPDAKLSQSPWWIPIVGGSFAAPYNVTTLQVFPSQWDYAPTDSSFRAFCSAKVRPVDTVTSGTANAGEWVYTNGSLVSVTWNGVTYVNGVHDGSVIKFYGTGFVPQPGAGSGIAWTAVIKTPLGMRRAIQPRANLN